MITETITLHFQDEAQQARFHHRLNSPITNAEKHIEALEDALRDCVYWLNEYAEDDDVSQLMAMHRAEELLKTPATK